MIKWRVQVSTENTGKKILSFPMEFAPACELADILTSKFSGIGQVALYSEVHPSGGNSDK